MSNTKVDEKAVCPYCGHEDYYTFHYGADTLICHHCDKEFAIKLETVITVKSAKFFDKICADCGLPMYDEEIIINNGECLNCGKKRFNDNRYNDSELDRDRSYWDCFKKQ